MEIDLAMKIVLFGQLKELAPDGWIDIPPVRDSGELRRQLEGRFSMLTALPYLLAIDRKIIDELVMIEPGQEIAILPPYSGG